MPKPKPWSQKRIGEQIKTMVRSFEAVDLDHDERREVLGILMPALWRRSGLDFHTFRATVLAAMPPDVRAEYRVRKGTIPDWARVGPAL